MSGLDWAVMFATLAGFVGYGVWRSRESKDLAGFLVAGRSMPWPMVALSIMATQASAITFLSTPGQGATDGLRFIQFYLGLPLAMIVLSITAVPLYHRLRVFTAYEFLEQRFDGKTRTLAAALFLTQRGLASGLGIYAPALVLSVVLGWNLHWTCALIGALVVLATAFGGSRAVSHTHVLQFVIIMGTMLAAFLLILQRLPEGLGFADACRVAGRLGRFNAINLHFDPADRYNLWSGLIGGGFLALSYFGTDQSQVGRYLTGRSIRESRLGLLFNGMVKVPMQFFILLLGVMVFVFYLFVIPPVFFNPMERARLASGETAADFAHLEQRHQALAERRRTEVQSMAGALRAHDAAAAAGAERNVDALQAELTGVREETVALLKRGHPDAQTSDTNYVFLSFVLGFLPAGMIGLVFAAMFAASMNSTASELNALTSTTVVDVWQRLPGVRKDERRDLTVSRVATLFWAGFAVVFAEYAARLGSLIEAVNILGSLFYGTILGIFLCAFYVKRVGGTAVFVAALVAEAVVIACFKLTTISFLWYNVIGCLMVVALALALSPLWPRKVTAMHAAAHA